MSRTSDSLWCCERTTAAVDMPCCCDCEALDHVCDRCCRCQGVNIDEVDRFFSTMVDRCRFPSCFGRGAIQVHLDLVMPLLMIPLGLVLASVNSFFTYLILASMGGSLLLYYRVWKRRQTRTRTKFFYIWALVSCIVIYYIFEIVVVVFREVLFWENVTLSALFATMMYCFHLTRCNPGVIKKRTSSSSSSEQHPNTKGPALYQTPPGGSTAQNGMLGSDHGGVAEADMNGYARPGIQHRDLCEVPLTSASSDTWCSHCQMDVPPRSAHCVVCGVCVQKRDHHCVWVDNCIGAANHRSFFIGIVTFLLCGCYGSHLMLTTVCTPEMYFDWFLFPADCRFVYNDFTSALGYVCALYTLLSVGGMCFVFTYQVLLISQNATSQEVHSAGRQGRVRCGMFLHGNHRSRGVWYNWSTFLLGRHNMYTPGHGEYA